MSLAEITRYDPDRVSPVGERAVVVGGSIAGLATARVLADAFDDVIVLERDSLPDKPVARAGAPQTSHPHALLEAGRATLEDLFPGFGGELLRTGGLMIDFSTDVREYNRGGYLAAPRERYPTYCASRALFEHVVRRQVDTVENIEVRDGCQVTGYIADGDPATVTGVNVRDGGSKTALAADLTVDATGRTSRTPVWLDQHGYDTPPVDEVAIDVSYRSIRLERPTDDRRMRIVTPSAPRTRGAALIPIEDNQWEVIVQGVHHDDPPADRRGLIKYTERLPTSIIADLMKQQPWVSDEIRQYPYPASLRRRYEALDTFPDGLVVVGDAIASFNPVYGQGMSVAALEAVCLHHTLATGGGDSVGERFFDRAERVVDNVWNVVVGADFEYPQTTGDKPAGTGLINWYIDRLIRKAHSDPALSEAFARVTRLEDSPTTLLRPSLAWRVLQPTIGTSPLRTLTNQTSAKPSTADSSSTGR